MTSRFSRTCSCGREIVVGIQTKLTAAGKPQLFSSAGDLMTLEQPICQSFLKESCLPAVSEVASRSLPVAPEVSAAYLALMKLEDEQRLWVFCWFCAGCGRFVGPGDACHCQRDE